jgi:hypothetical protein
VIYNVRIGLKISRRQKRKCAEKLSSLGVSFAAVGYDKELAATLRSFNIAATSGLSHLSGKAAEMALIFAKERGLKMAFTILGGSFFTATRTALRLLEETSDVFLSLADSDAVAEAVSEACGAVLQTSPPDDTIVIRFSDESFFIEYRNESVTPYDFSLSLPGTPFPDIPQALIPGLAEILEIYETVKKFRSLFRIEQNI